MRNVLLSIGALTGAVLATACSDGPMESSPDAASYGVVGQGRPTSINLYGLGGLSRAVPRSPCLDDVAYRQFDFWLGNWDVFSPAGPQVGTSMITMELDGCVIAESWTDADGGRGRSINTYDTDTDQWHQTWVSANTQGHLRMAGGIVNGEMVLAGVRESPVFGLTLFNEFRWATLDPDIVRQTGELRIPAIDLVSSFTGIYHRVEEIMPAAEAPRTDCQVGGVSEESRRLDFLIGDWSVETKNGRLLGESTVQTDLGGCLFEERFTTSRGYEAVAFTYWDRVVARWYRTYIDSEGERLELEGAFHGDRLVLLGSNGGPGGMVDVRLTLAPRAGGGVDQTVEISRDGGTTWQPALELQLVS